MTSALASGAVRLLRTRWLVRAPIWLYQHRLGWVMGGRLLMLEHRGRSSGLPRYVCLEAVDRPGPDTFVVASGFGGRAQWYRNLRADPRCRVSTGRRTRVPATARLMTAAESQAVLQDYQRRHARSWGRLRGVLEETYGPDLDTLPMVELSLDR